MLNVLLVFLSFMGDSLLLDICVFCWEKLVVGNGVMFVIVEIYICWWVEWLLWIFC